MKTSLLAALVLSLFAIHAEAREPESLTLACPVTQLPSQTDVARVFDVANLSQAYALRARVVGFAHRECMSGVDRVRIVAGPSANAVRSLVVTTP